MGQSWYYSRGTEQIGPVGIDRLAEMIRTGQVPEGSLVWTEGMAQWQPVQALAELATPVAPQDAAVAPPPPVAPWTTGAPAPVLGYQSYSDAHGNYAGFWQRFCAAFIDGVLLWVAAMIIDIGLFALAGENYFDHWPRSRGTVPMNVVILQLIGSVISLVIGWLYSALQESSVHQATLGKRAVGIIVTDINGQPISFGRATGRHFAKIISGIILLIGYIMAAFTERKQALHDMIANTLVLKNP